ncbi:basic leucine zipper 61-like [Malania oleifera]|uniref:basic leucine zipper 61-like n=1 Tax=Malania oleifera TaxID=397392 RepID=UPI0025ADFA70|nr:basic leucine zipper 61-like [Malania oleifera]
MAHLPPKIPSMAPSWPPSFPGHHPSPSPSPSPSWVDEFLDFSAARRGAHRRSASDSVTFLEAPFATPAPATAEECRTSTAVVSTAGPTALFDRFDDEQFLSMFSDEVSVAVPPRGSSTSNPSTPSDENSNNEERPPPLDQCHHQHPKHEPGEVDSSSEADPKARRPSSADPVVDPKRVKRILANRQSAQRSRVRKLQYISELERSVTSLQTEVSALSPRVAFLDHQRLILNVDNSALKQRIAALAQDKIFKDAHQEALKKEIERLRQVYQQQNLKKMNSSSATAAPPPPRTPPPHPPSADIMCGRTDKEQQLIN